MNSVTVILQFICPDRPGLVSELSTWIYKNNGNIRHADHHTDSGAGLFLSRIEWDLQGFSLDRDSISSEVNILAESLGGQVFLSFSDERLKVAVFASKQSHCLSDILWRSRSGELSMEVDLVVSNHKILEPLCKELNVPFYFIPMTKDNKKTSELEILKLLRTYKIDLVVLAKYMQILSPSFLKEFSSVINIHHSFLPAFKGSQPYHQAWERGVKLIGATAHYVTEDLDDGPIIEQVIINVSHRDEVQDLIRKGLDSERLALARALRLHINRQVMVYLGRTAVFA